MPIIAKFNGITIRMYFLQSEHNPPHIHAIYGEYAAAIDIQNGEILDGYIPKKVYDSLKSWFDSHEDELLDMWNKQVFSKIDV